MLERGFVAPEWPPAASVGNTTMPQQCQNNATAIPNPLPYKLNLCGDKQHLYTGVLTTSRGSKMVILYDRFNLPEDIFEVIFSTGQQKIVAHELVKYMASNKGEVTKTEMSLFATKLHEGQYETVLDEAPYSGKKVKLSYNKRQFYDRILTPMKAMGLIDYDLYKKTYKISDKFANDLMKIGLMWKQELRKIGFLS